MRLSEDVQRALRCPVCASKLTRTDARFECANAHSFPIIEGIPVLINEPASLFSINDYVKHKTTTARPTPKLKALLSGLLPDITLNVSTKANFMRFAKLLLEKNKRPRVLIIGGRIVGQGMEDILRNTAFEFVETDVSFGARTMLICDAHDLPFENCSFDGVIVQAVLHAVVDPYRCVEEIHRVLKSDGLVYSETGFMQQVCSGRYDFTRYTHLGHRHVFKRFEEIKSGAVCGPGMALAWSIQHFLYSFAGSERSRLLVRVFSRLTLFWLKYFDYYLIDKPGGLDAASGTYFLGRKSDKTLSDRELIALYRGIM